MTADPIGDEVFRLHVKHAGAQRFASDLAERDRYDMAKITARDFKLEDDSPLAWRIENLHAIGDNTSITAQYKTGKSTLMLNLLRSLCDGLPFLGNHVTAPTGTVVYWNMEVSENRMRNWIRRIDIVNDDKIMLVNMRGRRQPLYVESNVSYIIDWMNDVGAECWIIDPGARLLPGWPGSNNPENDNACIGEVVETLDKIKEETGIEDIWIPLHTGRESATRARGATKWDDWVDVRNILARKNVNDVDIRTFTADGRDVEIEEMYLGYDDASKRVWVEEGMEAMQVTADARAVVAALLDGPVKGRSMNAALKGVGTDRKARAIAEAEKRGWIQIVGNVHSAVDTHPDVISMMISAKGI